jgi:hypothetical protein
MKLGRGFMRFSLPLLLWTGLGGQPARATEDWHQVLAEDGVLGYSRAVAGSDVLEFRSTVVLPARIELVGTILRDVEGLKKPGSSCKEARFVENSDQNHYIFYAHYGFPIPLDDRDVVLRVSTTYDFAMGRAIATLQAVDDPRVPHRSGIVRITTFTAQFIIEYLGRDRTGIVYTMHADPGGHIPAFVVNYGNKHGLRDNVDDLRKATRDPKYLKAAAGSTDKALVESIVHDERKMTDIVTNRLGDYIHDRDFIALVTNDVRVMTSLVRGDGRVGEILLHGWGSRESKRQAVVELLKEWLASRTQDRAAIQRIADDRSLVDRLLSGQGGGAATLQAAVAALPTKGP